MQYRTSYESPLGSMTLASDDLGIIGLWFDGQKYYGSRLTGDESSEENAVLTEARHWLDQYYAGKQPEMTITLHLTGTPFQRQVWEVLQTIPYGETMTYGAIAQRLCEMYGYESMSAQAVGGAVGRNPVSILVPCHRVIGAKGSLTGYAGGIERKSWLLELERGDLSMEEQIKRIQYMGDLYHRIVEHIEANPDSRQAWDEVEAEVKELAEYYEGPDWMADFDAEQEGKIPRELDRGILTEDTIWDLLSMKPE